MVIIVPTAITDAMLVSSTVPETDYAAWDGGVSYPIGQRCIRTATHKVYECLVVNSGNIPENNLTGTTPKWLEVSATNRWKAFDSKLTDQTSQASSITYVIEPGIIQALALFNLDATSVTIAMTYTINGVPNTEVYSYSGDLLSTSNVIDGYSYFFKPIVFKTELAFLDLPPYAGRITITINNSNSAAKVGEIVVGQLQSLGLTNYNPSISIIDYSRKDADAFGNFTVLKRAYSSRMSCDMWLPSQLVDELKRMLVLYRATPVVWIGAEDPETDTSLYASMMVYGFYKSFNIVIKNDNSSGCTLEIEGLT